MIKFYLSLFALSLMPACKPAIQNADLLRQSTLAQQRIDVGRTISFLIKRKINCPTIIRDAGECHSNELGDINTTYCRLEGEPIPEDQTIDFKIEKHGPPQSAPGFRLISEKNNYSLGCFYINTIADLEGALGLTYIRVAEYK